MKIEPVGTKRNLQIAELKGWKLQKYTDKLDRTWGLAWQYPIGKFICWEKHFDCTFKTQFSTMPNGHPTKATWDLCDELPIKQQAAIFEQYKMQLLHWGIERMEHEMKNKDFNVPKPDFADCASTAWILWKEAVMKMKEDKKCFACDCTEYSWKKWGKARCCKCEKETTHTIRHEGRFIQTHCTECCYTDTDDMVDLINPNK